jgi:CheY-like chemotaxis protein
MSTKILIVDDNNTARELLRYDLQLGGYKVDEARDGVEALEHLHTGSYALVISDYQMPRCNGLELLTNIKNLWRDLPVLLMSSYMTKEQEQSAKQQGAHSVLPKSIKRNELLSIVNNARQKAEFPLTAS